MGEERQPAEPDFLSAGERQPYEELAEELVEGLRAPGTRPRGRRANPPAAAPDPYNAICRWIDVEGAASGPLAGMRITVKDSIAIAGVPLGCGSALLKGYVPEFDSVVVRRLLAAGAHLVGVTNMDDLAFCGDGSSGFNGPVLNPFARDRLAGGSSGGAAASLCLPGVDAAIGTDQGGSVRVPASWCGVVGIKPTRGAVPYDGAVGLDPLLDHVGVLARDVATTAVVLDALRTPAPGEAREEPVPADPGRFVAREPGDLRIGLLREGLHPDLGVEPEVAAAMEQLSESLRGGGVSVEERSVPAHLDSGGAELPRSAQGLNALLAGAASGSGRCGAGWPSLAAALAAGMRTEAQRLSPQVKAGIMVGRWLEENSLGFPYLRSARRAAALAAAYDAALEGLDALLLPATPMPARPLAPPGNLRRRVLAGWEPLANTAQFNLAGHPAVSVPLCVVGSLPLGAMLVGRLDRDRELLAVAAGLEALAER